MEPDLASMVAAAKAGSEVAWRQLVEAFQAPLVRLAWMLTGDRELAADVAQEAFVEAFVRLRQLREPKAFGGWLRTMAVRIAQRRREHRKWQPEQEIEHHRTPETELAGVELRQSVDRALAALSPLCREALALAMEGGLTSAEAATLLGCSPEAYRVRLHKARQQMRRHLAAFLEE
ncbi:MAG TPA: sigma-70 family RNA polymerase sigma factor [Planctomycetota bacterium]|nr:sigma-70 family RNA polymerase sigma factor [Planctomycetota bacterium]HRR80914.1 sigma-70 family RNA polymerase sigma factor [Planctomycetota bacterium]HRT93856.1 sigma-70 family RNA polymerase sigma factor [Planctomycetota bacterium]